VDPQSDNLERLALAFGMAYSTLAAIAEGGEAGDAESVNFPTAQIPRRVPLLSFAQAGRLADSTRLDQLSDATDWIEFPKKRHGVRTIAMRVSGESMEPTYRHGDIIYVDPDVAPVHGKDVVIRLGNDMILKRLVVEGERRFLKPLNPNWPEKFINMPPDARIVGVVVGRYTDV